MSSEEKKTITEKLQSQLGDLNAELERLKARKEAVKAEAKAEFDEKLASLRFRQQEAEQKLARLKEAGDSAWQDISEGLAKSVADLKESYARTKEHFE